MAEPKVLARVSGFVDRFQCGSYTLGKEYPVVAQPDDIGYDRDDADAFWIVDDDGDAILCWWHFDPDCNFERVVL